jgi:putative membrane protein insertion efficiency factor
MARLLILPIRVYQWTLSPLLQLLSFGKGCCRFEPSCSRYAVEALQKHGAARGMLLTVKRILRCNPWGPAGWDPVPARQGYCKHGHTKN